jgi:hypothetical protein
MSHNPVRPGNALGGARRYTEAEAQLITANTPGLKAGGGQPPVKPAINPHPARQFRVAKKGTPGALRLKVATPKAKAQTAADDRTKAALREGAEKDKIVIRFKGCLSRWIERQAEVEAQLAATRSPEAKADLQARWDAECKRMEGLIAKATHAVAKATGRTFTIEPTFTAEERQAHADRMLHLKSEERLGRVSIAEVKAAEAAGPQRTPKAKAAGMDARLASIITLANAGRASAADVARVRAEVEAGR